MAAETHAGFTWGLPCPLPSASRLSLTKPSSPPILTRPPIPPQTAQADTAIAKGVGGKTANAVKELSTNAAISVDAAGRRRRLALVMDEVDGMSAGDRGGVADLIKTIAKSKVPIIAICNDRYNPKVRGAETGNWDWDWI